MLSLGVRRQTSDVRPKFLRNGRCPLTTTPTITTGHAERLGATWDGEGTNFALFSAHAEAVELCLFDASGGHEIARYRLPERTHDVWHGYLPGAARGTVYGYRVHGRYDPGAGLRFNPHKLLLDPYARELRGRFAWHETHFAFDLAGPYQDLAMDDRDNADHMVKGVVCGDGDTGRARRRALVPWGKTVIYETHVRGFTMLHPEVPELARGKFAGMATPAVVAYLKALGITSVELMPSQAFIDELHLYDKGLKNYWGYNSLNFFSPHQAYLSNGERQEFRHMVDALHDAGIEVILDVVYNHTCEGNHLGPTLSFKGIDNLSYYQLMPGDKRFFINDSGCGNTLNVRHPRVAQLVMDSLRYWAVEMGVDGFRFDLATILGRKEMGFSPQAAFFQMVAQDPALAGCKFIAEPWDIGPGGYQLGQFPAGWSEWNDHYRDSVRRFWKGSAGELPELARRLHGSGDLFEHAGRRPHASINFVTSHDGFTLRDLVSYAERHNEANLENNQDGHRENHSHNNGVEGETASAEINALRWRQQRNFLATLLLSQGVPMLLAGDEFGHSQGGNNNAYCQDNAINWLDWGAIGGEGRQLTAFVRKLLCLRRSFPVLQADKYRHLPHVCSDDGILWLNASGTLMRDEHWHEHQNRVLGYLLTEPCASGSGRRRQLLVLFNGSGHPANFVLPETDDGEWCLYLDTADPDLTPQIIDDDETTAQELQSYSVKILIAGDVSALAC